MDLVKIENECKKIIKYMQEKYYDFPSGKCGITSRILAYVLEKKYLINCVIIVSGVLKIDPIQSHAWVWADGYIIDITISQFNNRYNFSFPNIYISDNNNDYNKIFNYRAFNSKIISINEDEDIKGYYERNDYKIKEDKVIINYNGQDLGN